MTAKTCNNDCQDVHQPPNVSPTVFAQHLRKFRFLCATLESVRSEQICRILDAVCYVSRTVCTEKNSSTTTMWHLKNLGVGIRVPASITHVGRKKFWTLSPNYLDAPGKRVTQYQLTPKTRWRTFRDYKSFLLDSAHQSRPCSSLLLDSCCVPSAWTCAPSLTVIVWL